MKCRLVCVSTFLDTEMKENVVSLVLRNLSPSHSQDLTLTRNPILVVRILTKFGQKHTSDSMINEWLKIVILENIKPLLSTPL